MDREHFTNTQNFDRVQDVREQRILSMKSKQRYFVKYFENMTMFKLTLN